MKKVVFYLFFISVLCITALATSLELKPVLYGQVFDGETPADGAIVSVYPESDVDDILTDIVGVDGNTALSSYWKVNLNNLVTDVQDGDKIIVLANDGEAEAYYTVDLTEGTHFLLLNLNSTYQDYDEDGYTGDVDCDDHNATIYPGAPDEFGDGIDQDCSGEDGPGNYGTIDVIQGWTTFTLTYNPIGISNSEELGQAIDAGCDVVMAYNEDNQLMEDDILGLDDPSLALSGTEEYFIHCDAEATYTYQGELWT